MCAMYTAYTPDVSRLSSDEINHRRWHLPHFARHGTVKTAENSFRPLIFFICLCVSIDKLSALRSGISKQIFRSVPRASYATRDEANVTLLSSDYPRSVADIEKSTDPLSFVGQRYFSLACIQRSSFCSRSEVGISLLDFSFLARLDSPQIREKNSSSI